MQNSPDSPIPSDGRPAADHREVQQSGPPPSEAKDQGTPATGAGAHATDHKEKQDSPPPRPSGQAATKGDDSKTMKDEIKFLKFELRELSKNCDELEDSNTHLLQSRNEALYECDSYQDRIQEMSNENSRLENEVDDTKQKMDDLEFALTEARGELDLMDGAKNQNSSSGDAQNTESGQSNQELAIIGAELEKSEQLRGELEGNNTKLIQQKADLENQLEYHEVTATELANRNRALEGDVVELRLKIEDLEKALSEIDATHHDSRHTEEMNSEVEKSKDELARYQRMAEELQGRNALLLQQKNDLFIQVQTYQSSITSTEASSRKAMEQLESAGNEISSLRLSLEKAKTDISSLEEQLKNSGDASQCMIL